MSPLPRRIAVVLPDLGIGGAERLHLTLTREWEALGHRVELVLLRARGGLLEQVPKSVRVVDLGAARIRSLVRPLARYLRETPPDVLLAAMWPVTTLAIVAARMAGYRGRLVVSDHVAYSHSPQLRSRARRLIFRHSVRRLYPLADARVAVSAGVADDVVARTGLERSSFRVLYNPAGNGGRARPPAARPSTLQDVHGPIVLSVGTLKPQKDCALLLRAFARLPAELGATLVFVGDGPDRAALATLARSLELGARCRFVGAVLDPDPYYAAADVFVLSSRFEGFGNVLVEAMSHGVPVVSTDCPSGPREILADGDYGMLVPVGDERRMSEAIAEVLAMPSNAEELRRRAGRFAPEAIAREYLEVMFGAKDLG